MVSTTASQQEGMGVQVSALAFLCLYMRGFPPHTPLSSHGPKTRLLGELMSLWSVCGCEWSVSVWWSARDLTRADPAYHPLAAGTGFQQTQVWIKQVQKVDENLLWVDHRPENKFTKTCFQSNILPYCPNDNNIPDVITPEQPDQCVYFLAIVLAC